MGVFCSFCSTDVNYNYREKKESIGTNLVCTFKSEVQSLVCTFSFPVAKRCPAIDTLKQVLPPSDTTFHKNAVDGELRKEAVIMKKA